MGTPDLRGTPGTFSYYTDDPEFENGSVSGGIIRRVQLRQHTVNAALEGPLNEFLEDKPRAHLDFVVHVDPEHSVAEIRIAGDRALLNVGEWSGWVPVRFALVPWLAEVPGMVRFYLQEVRPHFRLYASPVNIDPGDPAQPISTPESYGPELRAAAGPFYTQEMPEDTKALSAHVVSPDEFLAQSALVLKERRRLLNHELKRFREEQRRGLLFFYLSSIDQRSHMLWGQMDRTHPAHVPETPSNLVEAIRDSYVEIDEILGTVLEQLEEETTLIVMSDHGFAPFRRQAHLNSWLEQNGYLAIKERADRTSDWLASVDWGATRAFAIGLNSLYLNVRGRERLGVVDPAERNALAREIVAKLQTWTDPQTGQPVVSQPLLREDIYHGPRVPDAPDILVGYSRGYRASWATTSGQVPEVLLEDNDREWSGDHCMDARTVPGLLLSNRPLAISEAGLRDLPVSILVHFGVEPPPQMNGRSVF
jgi:hypothetical protein